MTVVLTLYIYIDKTLITRTIQDLRYREVLLDLVINRKLIFKMHFHLLL